MLLRLESQRCCSKLSCTRHSFESPSSLSTEKDLEPFQFFSITVVLQDLCWRVSTFSFQIAQLSPAPLYLSLVPLSINILIYLSTNSCPFHWTSHAFPILMLSLSHVPLTEQLITRLAFPLLPLISFSSVPHKPTVLGCSSWQEVHFTLIIKMKSSEHGFKPVTFSNVAFSWRASFCRR